MEGHSFLSNFSFHRPTATTAIAIAIAIAIADKAKVSSVHRVSLSQGNSLAFDYTGNKESLSSCDIKAVAVRVDTTGVSRS